MQIFTLVRSLSSHTAAVSRSTLVSGLLVLLGLAGPARAQTTAWEAALTATAQSNGSTSQIQATAINAAGEVLVSGFFTGQVTFGSTVLVSSTTTSGGATVNTVDLFVAKYLPATNTWAWAYRGGGTGADQCLGLAVSGNAVYVTGFINNDLANTNNVTLADSRSTPTAVYGTSNVRFTNDLLLARYTDQGSSAVLDWVQVGGGTGNDAGAAVAVSGSSLYVTGYSDNNLTDDDAVRFGSDGTATTTASLTTLRGTSATVSNDVLLAKYTDNVANGGSGGSLQWAQVGGGTGGDRGLGVAVNGSSVYVTGYFNNNLTDDNAVRFGSDGTATTTASLTTLRGTSATVSNDVLLVKYTDNAAGGSNSASLQWTQVGGGTGVDQCLGVAVNGSSVYVTGYINNNLADGNAVRFGSDGTAATTTGLTTVRGTSTSASPSNDFLLAKYADNTTGAALAWVQVGGGTGQDQGQAIAVNGRNVYVTGFIDNTSANGRNVFFGSDGTATTTTGLTPVPGASNSISNDLLLVRYTDYSYKVGSGLQWARVGGGTGTDRGQAVAVNGQLVYAAGRVTPPALFPTSSSTPISLTQPASSQALVLASLTDNDPTPLPVQLLAFVATREGRGTARLTWATASEAKSQAFQVERSADGRQFAAIGTVAAAGNSSSLRNYELLDAELPTGAARLYYRLKQVDADGTFSYSPVRTVALTDAAAAPVLYPNPAHGGAATLTGAQPGAVITVTDALGRPVAHATADAAGTAALVLPQGLATGLYVVHVGSKAVRLTVE